MELTVGTIITGKVTSITKFGAFVALPDGKSGLVHISEVAGTFVSDVHDFLTEGQEVPVKVLSVSPEGKISLSVKQAQPPKPRPQYADRPARPRPPRPNPARPNPSQPAAPPAELTFEDGCLTLGMKPEKNAVLVFIDIPQVKSLIDAAHIVGRNDTRALPQTALIQRADLLGQNDAVLGQPAAVRPHADVRRQAVLVLAACDGCRNDRGAVPVADLILNDKYRTYAPLLGPHDGA